MTYGELIDELDALANGMIGKKAEGKTVNPDDQSVLDLFQLVTKLRASSPPTGAK